MNSSNHPLNKLIPGIPLSEYLKIDAVSSSNLKHAMRSMAHYKAALTEKKERSDAMEFGSLVHDMLHKREEFWDLAVTEPDVDMRTKAGKETMYEFRAKLGSKSITIPHDWRPHVEGIYKSCMSHPLVKNLILTGSGESTLLTQDPGTGLMMRCRPDFISEKGHAVDFKTTRDAQPIEFERQIFSSKYRWDLQAGMYTQCGNMSGEFKGDLFIFIGLEKEPPYGISVHTIGGRSLEIVHSQWRHIMIKIAECSRSGEWPSYSHEARDLVPPAWHNEFGIDV
jgi:exodeoxyribonuclease VIII